MDAGFKTCPIEDEKNVDKRRAALGLAVLADCLRDARADLRKISEKLYDR